MNEQPSGAIPNNAKIPIDIRAVAEAAAQLAKTDGPGQSRGTISLADANRIYRFEHCSDCGRGGHTGHTLYTIIKNVATLEMAKACAAHVGAYIRPKDLKKRQKRS